MLPIDLCYHEPMNQKQTRIASLERLRAARWDEFRKNPSALNRKRHSIA